MVKNKKDRINGGILVVILSMLVAIYVLAKNGIVPFGDLSPFLTDCADQYIEFILYSNHSSFFEKLYSFSKGMGGGMIGLDSYYTHSILNVIFALFPVEKAEIAFFVVFVIRCCAMSLFMYIYLCAHFENCYKNIPFAIGYAFFPYFMLYYFNIIWFDCFALFPLLILGTEKIVSENKRTLFLIVFTYITWSNYYMAFISAVAVVVWFVYLHVIDDNFSFKKLCTNFLNMAHNAMLCICINAPFLVTSYLRLRKNKLGIDGIHSWEGVKQFGWRILPTMLFERTWMYESFVPFLNCVVCGAFVLVFVFSQKIDKLKKHALLSVFTMFILGLTLRPLSFMWTAFSVPEGFPFRQTFVYAFTFLLLSRWGFEIIDKKSAHLTALAMVVLLVGGICFYFKYRYLPWGKTSFSITLLAFSITVIALLLKERFNSFVTPLLTFYIVIAIAAQACYYLGFTTTSEYRDLVTSYNKGDFSRIYTDDMAAIQQMDESSFYRIETIGSQKIINSSFLYDLNTLSHFSSLYDKNQENLLVHFGTDKSFYGTKYQHINPVVDSLLGLRYLIVDDDVYIKNYLSESAGNKVLLENPYAFPVFYTGDSNSAQYSENPTEHLNNMSQLLAGVNVLDTNAGTDYRALEKLSQSVKKIPVEIIKIDGAKVKLKVGRGAKYLLTSVMYEDEWIVKVNGKKTDQEKYMEYFISVPLEEEVENEIEMFYMPKGLLSGIAIMTIAILCESAYMIIKKKLS